MTGPEDSQGTRPISVAELLARNGTIGAPPAGGRRRRRRGDTDSISVAELTGEIPIVTDRDIVDQADEAVVDEPIVDETVVDQAVVDETSAEQDVGEPVELTSPAAGNGVVDHDTDAEAIDVADQADVAEEAEETGQVDEDTEADAVDEDETEDETDDDYAGAVSDYAAHIQQRDETDVDVDFFAPPRRSSYAPRRSNAVGAGAEEMSPDPDPVEDDTALEWSEPEPGSVDIDDEEGAEKSDSSPSYGRSVAGTLFGGQTVADDLARRGTPPGPDDDIIELDEDDDAAEPAPPRARSSFMQGVWIVGQCILAVAFGAGLFVAFDQLWKWNNIVALALSVLVILGLVVGVRVVRKTEDIGSTLIAVAVGALVTLGPLALLQSG